MAKNKGYVKLDESFETKGRKLDLIEKLAKYHEKLFFHLKGKKHKQKNDGYVELNEIGK